MREREFRDALTRAGDAVRGIETDVIEWGRWTP